MPVHPMLVEAAASSTWLTSAHLAVTIDRLNRYWHDHDWEALLAKEPCFSVLKMRTEEAMKKTEK